MFVKGFKNFSNMIKQASKKIYEKFYKLISKQEIRVYKILKKSKIKQANTKASKQRKVLKTFKASKAKKSFWKIIVKESFTFFEMFFGKVKPFIKAYTH